MTMTVAMRPAAFASGIGRSNVADFVHWLRTHRTAVVVAFLLGFAYPLTSLASAFGVAPELPAAAVGSGLLRTVMQGALNGPAFLIAGYVLQRLNLTGWHAALASVVLAVMCAALFGAMAYSMAWTDMLVGTGDARLFTFDSMANTVSMALLFCAHLQHSRAHADAAARLDSAKSAQREARRRLAYGQLKAVQARIDPQFLFDMLDAVRRAYETDAGRAERLLDELVAFLRAALPRLQDASSTIPREAETARALARLHALSADLPVAMTVDIDAVLMAARFPPGVLLPLLDEALHARAGACALTAARRGADSVIELTLPAAPSAPTVERVRAVLDDLHGVAAGLRIEPAGDAVRASVRVPYERA